MGKITGDIDDFLVLRHPDKSPAVMRISRIKDILPMDPHRCKIIYDNGMEMIVEGSCTVVKMKIADKLTNGEAKKHGKRKG
jgi:hypothetical protein